MVAAAALCACEDGAPAAGGTSASAEAQAKKTATATSAAKEAPTKPAGFEPEKAKELIVKLGGSGDEKKAATDDLIAMGAEVVPTLQAWMLKADNDAAAAPKNKQWDILKPMQTALFVCRKIGEPCLPALEALAAQTKTEGTKTNVCLHLEQGFKKPCK